MIELQYFYFYVSMTLDAHDLGFYRLQNCLLKTLIKLLNFIIEKKVREAPTYLFFNFLTGLKKAYFVGHEK